MFKSEFAVSLGNWTQLPRKSSVRHDSHGFNPKARRAVFHDRLGRAPVALFRRLPPLTTRISPNDVPTFSAVSWRGIFVTRSDSERGCTAQ
jgi:hypothetical protein